MACRTSHVSDADRQHSESMRCTLCLVTQLTVCGNSALARLCFSNCAECKLEMSQSSPGLIQGICFVSQYEKQAREWIEPGQHLNKLCIRLSLHCRGGHITRLQYPDATPRIPPDFRDCFTSFAQYGSHLQSQQQMHVAAKIGTHFQGKTQKMPVLYISEKINQTAVSLQRSEVSG